MAANEEHVRQMFYRSPFIRSLGIELTGIGEGWCEARMVARDGLQQQHGHIHAAVVTAIADHTGGGAAGTMLQPGEDVITVEFKVSFLRPAAGESLRCKGTVLRSGKNLIFCESEVFAGKSSEEKLVAKLMTTLAVLR